MEMQVLADKVSLLEALVEVPIKQAMAERGVVSPYPHHLLFL